MENKNYYYTEQAIFMVKRFVFDWKLSMKFSSIQDKNLLFKNCTNKTYKENYQLYLIMQEQSIQLEANLSPGCKSVLPARSSNSDNF